MCGRRRHPERQRRLDLEREPHQDARRRVGFALRGRGGRRSARMRPPSRARLLSATSPPAWSPSDDAGEEPNSHVQLWETSRAARSDLPDADDPRSARSPAAGPAAPAACRTGRMITVSDPSAVVARDQASGTPTRNAQDDRPHGDRERDAEREYVTRDKTSRPSASEPKGWAEVQRRKAPARTRSHRGREAQGAAPGWRPGLQGWSGRCAPSGGRGRSRCRAEGDGCGGRHGAVLLDRAGSTSPTIRQERHQDEQGRHHEDPARTTV